MHITIDRAYRIDILVERDKVLIENKSVKEIQDIHVAQLLSYLRLSGISLGFLFDFNIPSFKDGICARVLFRAVTVFPNVSRQDNG
ncbi:MAG: GxxExxY protein [Treponema sp.]|nr:GxxExxY protein [Treponema sp.]